MELHLQVLDSLAAKVAEIAKEGTCPLPPNEQQRLEKLYSYDVLDSLPEKEFDRITSMAARVFGVPICLVSLVDAGRQWFKSNHGLVDNGEKVAETHRCLSFCAHTLLQAPGESEVLVVQDANSDPRFKANDLVTGFPSVVFYAGAPLVTADGIKLGALCLIDHTPRGFSEDEKLSLEAMAACVVQALDLRIMKRLQAERNAALEDARQQKAEKDILLRAVSCFSEGLFMLDTTKPHRPISFVNEAWCKITGFSSQQAIGKSINLLFGEGADTNAPPTIETDPVVIQRNKSGSQMRMKCFRPRPPGESPCGSLEYWGRLHLQVVSSGDEAVSNALSPATNVLGVLSDVTAVVELQGNRKQAIHDSNQKMLDVISVPVLRTDAKKVRTRTLTRKNCTRRYQRAQRPAS
jgi:PAS domain-containing protein